jgi:hypothetical protein
VRAIIAEIRLLVDYASSNAIQSIVDLKVPKDVSSDSPYTALECLKRLDCIEQNLPNITGSDTAFLYLLRDRLNELVKPATGMTIAYTTMATITGGRGGIPQAPRLHLAEEAHPALKHLARFHRFCSYAFVCLAVFAASFAVWESTKVALGKSLFASLQELRAQQAAINLEKMHLETAHESSKRRISPTFPNGGNQDNQSYSLRACESASYRFYELPKPEQEKLTLWAENRRKIEQAKSNGSGPPQPYEVLVFEAPAERDVCDRDTILASNFGLFYQGLHRYETDWPALVGRSFTLAESASDGLLYVPKLLYQGSVALFSLVGGGSAQSAPATAPIAVVGNDIEWVVVARLRVLGNYVLPVVVSLLGAIAYVMVDYYAKIRDYLLAPRDLSLAWIRLVLGTVVGACIGLLYSSGTPVAQAPSSVPNVSALASALSLTSSGIAFLVGFGVEGVVTMLQSVVHRLFPTT